MSMPEIPTLIVAFACLGFAILITIGIFIALLCGKGKGIITLIFEIVALDAICLSFLYFNASVPTASKIGDIEFVNSHVQAEEVISRLKFIPDERVVYVEQGEEGVETPYAMINSNTVKFISPIDNKAYICDVSENKYVFWSHQDVTMTIREEEGDQRIQMSQKTEGYSGQVQAAEAEDQDDQDVVVEAIE